MTNSWQPSYPPFKDFKKTTFQKAAELSQFIYQIGEYPHLRQPSKEIPVEKISTQEYQSKFQYLKNCLIKYREITRAGRGITAVQIGIPERFSVIYTPEELLLIINPKILKQSPNQLLYPEMCMSANPIIAPTIRPSWIEFEYCNEKAQKQHWNTKADTENGKMLNRVFQHEIDHMEGIINIDKVQSPTQLILESDPNFYQTATFQEI